MSTRGGTKTVILAKPKCVRCAIYTRKSSEEGLALEFNSLDAQRESGEAYVAAQDFDEHARCAWRVGGLLQRRSAVRRRLRLRRGARRTRRSRIRS